MRTQMTLTAWLHGIANAMVCAVGVFGTWLTIGWLISFATDKTMGESGTVALAIIWGGCLLGLVAGWLHGLARQGSLLLDCGGHPTRWLFLANAVFFAIAGICCFFATDRFVGQMGPLFAFSFSGYWVLMGMGRLRIHEHGIWTYWGFMKWGRIKEYSWAADGTLLVRTTGTLSFLFRGAIPVPQERLNEFKQLLAQRFPAAPTT